MEKHLIDTGIINQDDYYPSIETVGFNNGIEKSRRVWINNVKIGEYPLVDFVLNAKIQQTRVFLKIENLSGKIEHIINENTKYDYYAAPYTPYRDFSIRFGLVWNFFQ